MDELTDWPVPTFGITIHNAAYPTVNSLSKSRPQRPTTSRAKTVASEETRSRSLRAMLLASLRSLREEVRLPASTRGDLSSWILRLHGVGHDQADHEPGQTPLGVPGMKQLSEWMAQIAGPEADPRERKATITRMERVKDSRTTAELASLYRENRQQFDSQFRQQALKVKDIANIPAGVPAAASFASFEEFLILLRASRALAMCLSVHGAHPLSLIARATKGDRRAALDLIKIDKMFLHDRCTENLIKKAELQNDHAFLKQLARVQTFLPKVSARGMQRLYFYGLFFMEHGEMPLPSQHELWRILDPHGRQYRSLSAFERDFQRHRKIFDRMVSNIATDILKDAEKENA